MNCPECEKDLSDIETPFGRVYICNICKIIILKMERAGASEMGFTMTKDGVIIGSNIDRSEIGEPINKEKWR